MSSSSFSPASEKSVSTPVDSALLGDRVMLAAIALSAIAAVVLGLRFVDSVLALVASGALVLIAGVAYGTARGTLASRLVLAFVQVGLVALHIQLAQGMLEFHFGVFVTLALLLVYLDWRPIVWAALLFAVHHVLFDRLQAAGFDQEALELSARQGLANGAFEESDEEAGAVAEAFFPATSGEGDTVAAESVSAIATVPDSLAEKLAVKAHSLGLAERQA